MPETRRFCWANDSPKVSSIFAPNERLPSSMIRWPLGKGSTLMMRTRVETMGPTCTFPPPSPEARFLCLSRSRSANETVAS